MPHTRGGLYEIDSIRHVGAEIVLVMLSGRLWHRQPKSISIGTVPVENLGQAEVHTISALIAEYAALKNEIAQRSTAQLGLVSLSITVAGAVAGFTLGSTETDRTAFALLLAYACPILGLLWIDNARAISAIGHYFSDVTWPMLRRLCQLRTKQMPSWEDLVRGDERGQRRRRLWLASPIPLAFTGPAIWALVFTGKNLADSWLFAIAWAVGAFFTARSGVAIASAIMKPANRIPRVTQFDPYVRG